MKDETADHVVGITKVLLTAQRKTTRMLFHAYGVIIGLAFFIVNWRINPDEGFWIPLVGVLVGTQLIGYFVAWKPFLNKRMIPFENEVIEKMQNNQMQAISASAEKPDL